MRSFICITILVACSNLSVAASFDCAKATTKMEKTICSDEMLSEYDVRLNLAYIRTVSNHPIPKYVRARQRDWLNLHENIEDVEVLRHEFRQRIKHLELSRSDSMTIYSNVDANEYTYPSTDTIIEIYTFQKMKRLSIWGGWVQHKFASEEAGRPIYTGCEFDGDFVITNTDELEKTPLAPTHISARMDFSFYESKENERFWINIIIEGDNITHLSDFKTPSQLSVCYGFGQIPEGPFKKLSF